MSNQLDLFPADEIQPAQRFGQAAMEERLLPVYTQELLDHPPVRSLTREIEVNEQERLKLARRIAIRDVNRLLRVLPNAGLELGDMGRIATFKMLLADWLTACSEDAASGGNGSESVSVDELIERTREALNV